MLINNNPQNRLEIATETKKEYQPVKMHPFGLIIHGIRKYQPLKRPLHYN